MPRRRDSSCSRVCCAFAFVGIASLPVNGVRAENPHYAATKTSVTIPVEDGTIVLRPMGDGAIRVQITNRGRALDPESIVFPKAIAVPHFAVEETPQEIVVNAGALQARLNRKSGALRFTNAEGTLLLQEKDGERKLHGSIPNTVQDVFLSPNDEFLFGTGQFQDGYLNVRGLPRRLTQVNSQIAIPFLLSSKGYGLLWHNFGRTDLNPADTGIQLSRISVGPATSGDVTTSNGTQNQQLQEAVFSGEIDVTEPGSYALLLDVGQKMAHRYHVEVDGKTEVDFANFWLPPTTSWLSTLSAGKHSFRVIGDVKDQPSLLFRRADNLTTLRSFDTDVIDYVVFAGPTSDDVIRRYRDLTGAAPLMPAWAYGYIHCRERFHSQQELLQTLAEFRQKKIPLDTIVQDWQYWGKYGWNAMQFDENAYPDPAAMVPSVHAADAHLIVSVWSRIDPTSKIGKGFEDKHYFVPGTDWVDFFNKDAADLYWKDFSTRLMSLGIDAWWLDATEPENDDLHGRTVATGLGDSVRLLYPLLVNKTVYEGQRNDAPDKRVFILTRCAFLGQQRYASATWSGDVGSGWDTFKREITAGLDFSASGLPYWTTDTGGFFRPGAGQYTDPAYHERFLRWLEFSTFSPLMRVHGYQTDTEFWRYGKQVETVSRKYLDLRYRLMPYIYSEAAAVTMHGSTLMRPLVMDFAEDNTALEQSYEYMFGKEILVAPVVAPNTEVWDVYLPKCGRGWVNFWSGERFEGGQTIKADAKLDEIPLFVRAGSILPIGPREEWVGEKPEAPIEIRIYPGANASFSLYEDEGTNYNYEKGSYSIIPFRWNDQRGELTIDRRKGHFTGMRSERQILVRLVKSDTAGTAGMSKALSYTGDAVSLRLH